LRLVFSEVATNCTHLIAYKATRTKKFLMAIASSPYILNKSWLDESVKAGFFVGKKTFFRYV